MLSVDEKRKKIEDYCRDGCKSDECPLFHTSNTACYEPEVSDEDIEKHYEILFGEDTNDTPIDTDTIEKRGYTVEDFEKIEKEVYENFGVNRNNVSIDGILNMYEDYIKPGETEPAIEEKTIKHRVRQVDVKNVLANLMYGHKVFRVNLEKMAVCDLCDKSINCIRRDLDKPEYIYFIVEEAV